MGVSIFYQKLGLRKGQIGVINPSHKKREY